MLGKVGDAQKIFASVLVEIDEPDEAVAANITRRDIPFDKVLELARDGVKEPHPAVRLHRQLLDAVTIQIRLKQ